LRSNARVYRVNHFCRSRQLFLPVVARLIGARI
jgi:hypothetical protein